MQINNTQKKLIHVGLQKLGIDDALYRSMLRDRFNAASCLDLSYSQASAFIDELKKKGFRIHSRRQSRPPRSRAANVVYLPSKQQLMLIEHLRHDIQWRVHDGYQRFVFKMFARTHLKTATEAAKLIEALKNILKTQEKGAENQE